MTSTRTRQVAKYPYEQIQYAATKSAGDTLASSLPDGATVIVESDESQGGVRVRYTVASGVLTAGVADTAEMVEYGAPAGARSLQIKLSDIPSTLDYSLSGDGVSVEGDKFRDMISDLEEGSVVLIKKGAYLLNKDGANDFCININKRLHFIFEDNVTFISSSICRTVVRVSAQITCDGAPVIDGDYKTNHGVEVTLGAKGTTLRKWESKNVTQEFNSSFSAAPFSTVSEVGIIFDDCYAHDAISYPNAVIGDAAGTARGFHFYGTAPEFGINAVVNSRVDSIINTNGHSGAYEDEDGIVSQMSGSFVLIDNNTVSMCMKRGIKMQDRGVITNNKIISTRTEADNVSGSTSRMYSGISIYSDDVQASKNEIGSGTNFSGVLGGSYLYPIEIGGSGQAYSNIVASANKLKIGTLSSARSVEFIRLWGALQSLIVSENTIEVSVGPTINQVWGIRTDFDHPSIRAEVQINGNTIKNVSFPMQLRGGFSGSVSGNKLRSFNGGSGGIVVDSSASALRPKSLIFAGNMGFSTNDFTVRLNDSAIDGVSVLDTRTESTTTAAVSIAAGIRVHENNSTGGTARPHQLVAGSPPASGSWVRGDKTLNNDARDASPVVMWTCQFSGTPGTWRAASWMTVKGTTASRPTLTASDAGVQYLDTTLAAQGKPITWTGTVWVDSLGTAV